MVTIKSEREIKLMREACHIALKVQQEIERNIKPGISTKQLDEIAERTIKKLGAIAAQKNYPSIYEDVPAFPATICTSVNDGVIHGIPSKSTILKDGDVISIDLVVCKDGYHGDCARTYFVGKVDERIKKLVEVTKQAFFEGIKLAKKGNRLGDVSSAIGSFIEKNGFSVVTEFQGHGIGRHMHEEPCIPNKGKPNKGIKLLPGMTLAIEPMVLMGKPGVVELEDGWTIVSEDGSVSAHYENTILITENEAEILTI